jgi:hypothetical protein
MSAKESGHALQRTTNVLNVGNELFLVQQANLLLNCYNEVVVRDGQPHQPHNVVLQSGHQGGPLVVAVVTFRVTETVQEEPEVKKI